MTLHNFWFCHPTEIDHGWDQILSRYEQSEPWPEVCLPNKEDLLNTLLHTRDSAPGSAHRRSACRFLLSVVVWLEI